MPIINNDAQVILLLTSPLVRTTKDDIQPITTSDWNRLALWLRQKNLKPADLFLGDPAAHLSGWIDQRCPTERLLALLGRGVVLGIAMEKWQRAGIWVLSRMDADYPLKLKDRLKENAPPILYGCGNPKLLKADGIAVVGSRKAADDDLKFAFSLGENLARSGKTVVSGGARGIDETAMSGAINADGTVVGVLSDSLLRSSASQRYRQAIRHKNAVLISPYYPEAPFSAGSAMGRNKYIYCLAENAIVVHSGRNGGTWNGAVENLKKQWVPLWVKRSEDKQSGNGELVSRGGQWLSEDALTQGIINLPHYSSQEERLHIAEQLSVNDMATLSDYNNTKDKSNITSPPVKICDSASLYELFCKKLKVILVDGLMNQREMEVLLNLTPAQMSVWLKQAQDDGLIKKKLKPTRYELLDQVGDHQQTSMF